MALPSIEKLKLAELQELRTAIDSRIAAIEEDAKKEALEAMRQAAQAVGMQPHELLEHFSSAKGKKSRSKAPAKYRHPETGDEWTGRGRTPKWLQKELNDGRLKDDFLIL